MPEVVEISSDSESITDVSDFDDDELEVQQEEEEDEEEEEEDQIQEENLSIVVPKGKYEQDDDYDELEESEADSDGEEVKPQEKRLKLGTFKPPTVLAKVGEDGTPKPRSLGMRRSFAPLSSSSAGVASSFKTSASFGRKGVSGGSSSNSKPLLVLRTRVDPNSPSPNLSKPYKPPTVLDPKKMKTFAGGIRPGRTLGARRQAAILIHSLFDPNGDKAFIVYTPKVILSENEKLAKVAKNPGKPPDFEVEVVVDPLLARVLRPHQLEGVQFLFDCTTGRKAEGAFGCIMADEMGLGKTLQCITLLWTLLKQSERPGIPTIEKAIIVCPSSLVKNWANELVKWLGEGRVQPYACDGKGTKEQTTKDIENFASCKGRLISNPVLIISYESLRMYTPILMRTEIGLMLCDEGHRLKNSDNQTYQALNQLKAKRRVILSGTPIQNDLTEYFSLLSFIIPDVLGTGGEFRKKFELPILRGRDSDASELDRVKGEEKLKELAAIANKFIIRRTAELLTKYLPTKYDYIVFCKMMPFQTLIYKHFIKLGMKKLNEDGVKNSKGGQDSLKSMNFLKQIVNHPALLKENEIPASMIPPGFNFKQPLTEFSGKMLLLEQMILQMRAETDDKIVLISNYTHTLDYIGRLCDSRQWRNYRLDGSMAITKRQKMVDQFNDPSSPYFIFLLSSKAGGCGINLIGANRLILLDPDWNPANDAQAMARVWRDGQKKMCFLYRFIATGTIEEKMFQRQAHKQSLSSCVVDEGQDVERHFSRENLRQLFEFHEKTMCDTHDTFKCKRCKDGKQLIRPPEGTINTGATAADTSTWSHFSNLELSKIFDSLLLKQAPVQNVVTYVFQNKSHDSLPKPPKP